MIVTIGREELVNQASVYRWQIIGHRKTFQCV